jgi:RNA recognition motif-containing protein
MEAPVASKLFVGGLPYSVSSEALRDHFTQCGTVESAEVVTDRFSGQSRGFGFVQMSSEAEAKAAIATLDGTPFQGRRLTVNLANSPGQRSGASRDRGFGGGARRPARW